MKLSAGEHILQLVHGGCVENVPGKVVFLQQYHSSLVVQSPSGGERADGMFFPSGSLLPGLKVADCLPLFAVWEGFIGAAHAGWRGLADGIVEKLLLSVDAPLRHLIMGPCICPCCYSVGPEVRLAVSREDPMGIKGHPPGKADLRGSALRRAEAVCGKGFEIHHMNTCTLETPFLHSYRRDGTGSRNTLWLAPAVAG